MTRVKPGESQNWFAGRVPCMGKLNMKDCNLIKIVDVVAVANLFSWLYTKSFSV